MLQVLVKNVKDFMNEKWTKPLFDINFDAIAE